MLDKLERLDKIRFFIVDEDGKAVSSVWFMQGQGQGVYVAPSNLGANLKLSFHPTGGSQDGCDCQFGHPRRYAENATAKGFYPMRPLRWRRSPTPSSGALHIASIFFPTNDLMSAPQPPPNGKIKFALPRAPRGMATEAGLFISREHPDQLEKKFLNLGAMPLAYSDFPGDEFVSLVVRHAECPIIPKIEQQMNNGFVILEGAPPPGQHVNARAVIASDVPVTGGAFLLAEIGPVALTRKS